MKAGRLLCLGSPRVLQEKYGKEYMFTLYHPQNQEKLTKIIEEMGADMNVILDTNDLFRFSLLITARVKLSSVLSSLFSGGSFEFGHFGMAQATLTHTFTKIVQAES
jgi:hypothetical protein